MIQQGMPPEQYAAEIMRTKPDFVVYRPAGEMVLGENQHFIVVITPGGRLLATWTRATRENHPDQHVVVSTSSDGRSWSEPLKLDGASVNDAPGTGLASWAFPAGAAARDRWPCGPNRTIPALQAARPPSGRTSPAGD